MFTTGNLGLYVCLLPVKSRSTLACFVLFRLFVFFACFAFKIMNVLIWHR